MTADQRNMQHFYELLPDEKKAAIRDMAAMGFGVYQIAAATLLSVEQVRAVLGERATSHHCSIEDV